MCSQLWLVREWVWTNITFKWFSVSIWMCSQMWLHKEWFWTKITFEWFFTSVRIWMCSQLWLVREWFWKKFTFKWFFTSVRICMACQRITAQYLIVSVSYFALKLYSMPENCSTGMASLAFVLYFDAIWHPRELLHRNC